VAFLIANAKPLPLPDIAPQLTAGASKMPIVKWQTTAVNEKVDEKVNEKVNTAPQTTVVTASDVVKEVNDLVKEVNDAGEPTEVEEPQEQASYLLYRVVQAEGYTMGYEGMRYITSAILNLARDRGCSVDEVLTSGAYTVVNTGAIWRQEIYPETMAAVDDDLSSQIDYEIKYFRTGHYHGFGEAVFNYGNVYFSK
jgi:urease gamma subunit